MACGTRQFVGTRAPCSTPHPDILNNGGRLAKVPINQQAIGLYELSRRREAGLDGSATHALDVLHSPSLGAIVALGVLLMAIFLIWLAVAEAIYVANFGYATPASVGQFPHDVFNTSAGWNLIIVGTGVGFLFAVLALTMGAVSFPLLLDRDVGAAVALLTSIRVSGRHLHATE